MIRVDSLEITEFRGIRALTLNLKGQNYAVCGPNGTGKSGIVDALEFVLTGNISRLSGEGRGGISLKEHAPHVDSRNDPDKARVSVALTIPSLGKTVSISRTVKSPKSPRITSADPDVLAVLKQVAAHPEFVLSRRELIRYVLATPGKRSEEVQSLLHLDDVEEVRKHLQKIANASERKSADLARVAKDSGDNLLRALGVPELTRDKILAATNVQRSILGLPALPDLAEATSLKDGIVGPGVVQPSRIPKVQAQSDLTTARDSISDLASPDLAKQMADARKTLEALAADPAAATAVAREDFLAKGLALPEIDACPYCDTKWDPAALKAHVQTKLDHFKEITRLRESAESQLGPLLAHVGRLKTELRLIVGYGNRMTPVREFKGLSNYTAALTAHERALTNLMPLMDAMGALDGIPNIPGDVREELADIEKVVAALPEPTKQDAARDWLTVAQERLEVYRESHRKLTVARAQAERTRKLYDVFCKTSDGLLAALYGQVEKDFATLYGAINRGDEEAFSAKLIPSMGKLGFDVDFYGRGFFPPGAYHSEGHQDGMGLCLYLALMRYLQGESFTFAVLDDVLMSVDAAHRREVCGVLRAEFPNTQFLITTHDPIWLRHMKTEQLIDGGASIQFRNWSVDAGPTQWDDRDVWEEVDEHLRNSDIRAAAALLRHYLEYASGELCHRLRAKVEFRGDAQYQLGELLPAAVEQLRELYRRGKDAASSWNQRDQVATLADGALQFQELVTKSNVEQWQVNAAVHFNKWENLTKGDFEPVARAFRDLLAAFACPKCGGLLRVTPDRETAEMVRCNCGEMAINLKKRQPRVP